jgi:hypothetical protein
MSRATSMVRSARDSFPYDMMSAMRTRLALVTIAALLAACSGDGENSGTPVARPSANGAIGTTADLGAATLVCMSDGTIGPPDGLLTACSVNGLPFGLTKSEVMDAAVEMFGPFDFESTEEYPEPTTDGRFAAEFGDATFAFRIMSYGCFANSLCLFFGGDEEADLVFAGWQLLGGSVTDIDLATASGVTLGSSWADHLDEIVLEEGCEWSAVAAHEGMHVFLLSSDEFFGTDGVLAEELPDPATVKVDGAYAGEISIPTDGFC